MPVAGFPAYAGEAVDRLEAPVIAFYQAYANYRRDLAAWKAGDRRPAVVMASAAPVAKPIKVNQASAAKDVKPANQTRVASDGWRVQIGAFSDQAAAETAWKKARTQMPKLADFKPRYEPVPGKSLVRLQVAVSDGRDDAKKLCASATASGVNCVPIAG